MTTFDDLITFNEAYYDFDGNRIYPPEGLTGLIPTGIIEVTFEGPRVHLEVT